MRLTNSRPLINPPLPERELDPRVVLQQQEQAKDTSQWDGMDIEEEQPDKAKSNSPWIMPRTGLTLPTIPDTSDITEYLMKKVLTPDDVKAPKQLLHKLTTLQAQGAEIMWILRPVIYAFLLSKYHQNSKKSSWTPWLVGISIEAAARVLSKTGSMSGSGNGMTGLERDELKSRGWNMAWWGLRGAFYENVTKYIFPFLAQQCRRCANVFDNRSWVKGAAGKLKGKMLLDIVGTVIEDYDYLWDEYYFSTATM